MNEHLKHSQDHSYQKISHYKSAYLFLTSPLISNQVSTEHANFYLIMIWSNILFVVLNNKYIDSFWIVLSSWTCSYFLSVFQSLQLWSLYTRRSARHLAEPSASPVTYCKLTQLTTWSMSGNWAHAFLLWDSLVTKDMTPATMLKL